MPTRCLGGRAQALQQRARDVHLELEQRRNVERADKQKRRVKVKQRVEHQRGDGDDCKRSLRPVFL